MKTFLLLCLILASTGIKSQIVNLVSFPPIEPKENLSDVNIFDLGSDKLLVQNFYENNPDLNEGIYKKFYKSSSVNYLINSKDLKKTLELPEFPERDKDKHQAAMRDYNYRGPYSFPKYKITKTFRNTVTGISHSESEKTTEMFLHTFYKDGNTPPADQLLFAVNEKDANQMIKYHESSDGKVCTFNYRIDKKKINQMILKFWVYSDQYKLLRSDSVVVPYKETDDVRIWAYENGYIITKYYKDKTVFEVNDLTKNIVYNFTIDHPDKTTRFNQIKEIKGSTMILTGDYYYKNKTSREWVYGVLKITVNTNSKTLAEQTFFDTPEAGKDYQDETYRAIHSSFVTESGEYYSLTGYEPMSAPTGELSLEGSKSKFSLNYIGLDGQKWTKQLPIGLSLKSRPSLHNIDDVPYILYLGFDGNKTEQINFSSYVYGQPFPNYPAYLNDMGTPDLMLIRAFSMGKIEYQRFPMADYQSALVKNNELIITQQKGPAFNFAKLVPITD